MTYSLARRRAVRHELERCFVFDDDHAASGKTLVYAGHFASLDVETRSKSQKLTCISAAFDLVPARHRIELL
ncbi:hypothetical protein BSZ19_18340 [Bradyrhizobium japonicum]|uniref:Uncharacterized protein n=1 Tax=Bradyrhizobium japonicum TaxID=375 RepID=A0A1Y2JRX0_BRAJP|nr:hypothetical protein [Bradyrhizobium japonicum]OSJ32517.1 hypothetical protein BSZ19_18340 [Bradyrhizobium japonicum]